MRLTLVEFKKLQTTLVEFKKLQTTLVEFKKLQTTTTLVEFKKLQTPKNKYRAVKKDGCDSKKEYERLCELRILESAGLIKNLIPQVTYTLVGAQVAESGFKERPIKYTCDAQYIENGKLVVEDTKSEATRKRRDYIMARKLMLEKYGIEILEV